MDYIIYGLVAIAVILTILIAVVLLKFFTTWFRARLANAPVSWANLIGMFFRRVPYGMITDSRITAVKAGLDFSTDQLEAHYLAGGDVSNVVLACIAADKIFR